MKFVERNKLILILIVIFICSEIIVNPFGNFPLNDDWTFGKTTLLFLQSGAIYLGDFPAMTLYTHILWGALFTKIFGFSFTILRFSTLISTIIGIVFLNKIIIGVAGSRLAAFIACLVLLFNPMHFNLCNTFMTDINFNTLLILSSYFAIDFLRTRNSFSFLMVFVLSALTILLRQYGIIIPLCFTFSCLFLSSRKWIYLSLCVLLFSSIILILIYYENYLKTTLPPYAAYKFSGNNSNITSLGFWSNCFQNLELRYASILLHVLVYSFPFIVVFIFHLYKGFKLSTGIAVSIICSICVYFMFRNELFPRGNIFINTALGAETFPQTLQPQFHTELHTYSERIEKIAVMIKYVFSTFSLICFVLMVMKMMKQKLNPLKSKIELLYLLNLFFSYVFMILITESYYDRYHIPLITIALILFAYANMHIKMDGRLAIVPLLLFFYIAVSGTKDYLEINRIRWEAYYFLKDKMKVDHEVINGGFEVNCWNEGKSVSWPYFREAKDYSYVIQYDQEKGFTKVREYELQRYFPYKKDKIYILRNDSMKEPI